MEASSYCPTEHFIQCAFISIAPNHNNRDMYVVAAVRSSDHAASEGWCNMPLSHKHFLCAYVLFVEQLGV